MKSSWVHVGSACAVIAFSVLALGSGKKSDTKSEPAKTTAASPAASGAAATKPSDDDSVGKMGKPFMIDDAEWLVIEAKDLGKSVKPTAEYEEKVAKTEGRFVQVKYKVTNKGKQPGHVFEVKLTDSQDRVFGPWDKQLAYLPKDADDHFLDEVQPSMAHTYVQIFELPADAKGLKLRGAGFGIFAANKEIDIKL